MEFHWKCNRCNDEGIINVDIPKIGIDIRDYADEVSLIAYKSHSAESGKWIDGKIPDVPSCGIGYPMKVLIAVNFVSINK